METQIMPGNLVGDLEKLVKLRNMGELTERIFAEAKKNLLQGLPAFSVGAFSIEKERLIEEALDTISRKEQEAEEFFDHESFWESTTGIRVRHGVFYIAGMLLSFIISPIVPLLLFLLLLFERWVAYGRYPRGQLGRIFWYSELLFVWTSINTILKPAALVPLKKEDIKEHRKEALFEGIAFGIFFMCNLILAAIAFDTVTVIIYMTIISAYLALTIWKHSKAASQQYQISYDFEKLVRLYESDALTAEEFRAAKSLLVIDVYAPRVMLNWLFIRGLPCLALGLLLYSAGNNFMNEFIGLVIIACLLLTIDMPWAFYRWWYRKAVW